MSKQLPFLAEDGIFPEISGPLIQDEIFPFSPVGEPVEPMTGDYKFLEQYQTRPEWGRYFVSTVYQPGMKVLEPTSGNGLGFCQWIRKQDLTAVEIHQELYEQMKPYAREAYGMDIMDWFPSGNNPKKPFHVYDLIIGNLPYSKTEAIVRHLLPYLKPRGKIALLDRLSLLSSASRVPFWTELLKPLSITQVPRNVVIEIGGSGRYDLTWYVLGRRTAYDNIRGVDMHWQFKLPQSE
jgi:hypothetical protein